MKKIEVNDLINKFKEIHNDKYDYSLVEYKNMRTDIKIICPIHGVFEQLPSSHLNNRGCNKCGILYKAEKLSLTNEEFIEKSKQIHGDKYDYSLVEYKNNSTKVKIICSTHGEFEQLPNSHLLGNGCQSCVGTKKLTTKEFINRSVEIHGNKYDYSLVEYVNIKTKVKIICPKHGVFEKSPNIHIHGKSGCTKCKQSKGENEVRIFLEKNNIKYVCEKKFENCKDISLLKFDFYLSEYNLCIEYDGIQHFKSVKRFGGLEELKNVQQRDKIKTEYCKNNNIQLIRIKYDENVSERLKGII